MTLCAPDAAPEVRLIHPAARLPARPTPQDLVPEAVLLPEGAEAQDESRLDESAVPNINAGRIGAIEANDSIDVKQAQK